MTIDTRTKAMSPENGSAPQSAAVSVGEAAESAAPRSLAGSVTRLALGRGSILLGSLIATPILARLYGPECFGTLAVLVTVLGVLTPATSLCYVTAMPLADSASRRRALFVLSVLVGLVGAVVLGAATALWGGALADAFGVADLKRYVFCLPLLYLVTALMLPMDMALRCEREFGHVLQREMVANGSTRLFQIAAGLFGGGTAGGLIFGQVAGAVLGAVFMARRALRFVFKAPMPAFTFGQMNEAAARYRDFPLYQFGSQVLNALTAGLPIFVIGILFPARILGIYALTSRLMFIPGQLFASAAADVFYVEAAIQSRGAGKSSGAAEELLRLVLLFTAFPLTAVLALGPLLLTIFLGAEWHEAGVFAQILVPWVAATALAQPLASMLLVENRLAENLAYNIVLMLARLSALTIGGLLMGPRTALALFVGASLAVFATLIVRTLPLTRLGRRWAAKVIIQAYGEAALLVAPSAFCYWILGRPILSLGALALGTAGYAVLVYRWHPLAARLFRSATARIWCAGAFSAGESTT